MSKKGWFDRRFRERMDALREKEIHVMAQNGGRKRNKSDRECWCGASHRKVSKGLSCLIPGVIYSVEKASLGRR